MATDSDFTRDEWQRIEAAPYMAGLAVTYGDLSAKRGIADEAEETGEAIKSAVTSPSEIVRTLAARFAQGQRPALPRIPNQPSEAQAALIDGCKAAWELVKAKAPGEAPAYAQFLLDVAKAASSGAREGGFIGVGIAKVSEKEQMPLTALALALGLPS